jgi:hypothetical protein
MQLVVVFVELSSFKQMEKKLDYLINKIPGIQGFPFFRYVANSSHRSHSLSTLLMFASTVLLHFTDMFFFFAV